MTRFPLFLARIDLRIMITIVLLVAIGFGWVPDPAAGLAAAALLNIAPFPTRPDYTAIAVAYRNESLIADLVAPRHPVSAREFKYWKYRLADGFTIPDTKVGRKSAPNQVEFGADEATDSVEDHGLDDPIPQDDIDAAKNIPNYDPLADSTMMLTDTILLAREKRVADLVFDDTKYAAANKVTLAGNDQWSSTHADSDPVLDITAALDACVMRPNIMTIGRLAWTKLSMHAKIAAAIFKQGTTSGIATRQMVADLFELQEVLVGESWINTAKKGQTPVMARCWGKHCALLYRDKLAKPQQRGRMSFALTAQWGGRVAGTIADPNIGLKGGQIVRVGEQVKELVTANDLGYMIKNCIA